MARLFWTQKQDLVYGTCAISRHRFKSSQLSTSCTFQIVGTSYCQGLHLDFQCVGCALHLLKDERDIWIHRTPEDGYSCEPGNKLRE
jgi:hypothetical protein